MNRPALLDVNVLVALFDPNHLHHELAHEWFADHRAQGWATCPITVNGFVRVLSHPINGVVPARPPELLDRLSIFCSDPGHTSWPASVSLLDESLFRRAHLAGPRQITDIYLLGLAKRMKGVLATFDRTIPIGAVVGASQNTLAVIGFANDELPRQLS